MAALRLALILSMLAWRATAANSNGLFNAQPYCTYDWADSRYITFYGTVTATYWFDSTCCDLRYGGHENEDAACSSQGFGFLPDNNTWLYVGKNPTSWDDNPWFFELYHLTYDRNFSYVTTDSLTELDFASSVLACWEDDLPCLWTAYTPTFREERQLDLTKANVSLANGTYRVSGDQGAWAGNASDAYHPGVSIARSSCDYLDDNKDLQRTVSFVDFQWKDGINFTYSLVFSNTSASFEIATSVNGSRLELSFAGERHDSESLPVELDTSDDALPHFKFINGSALWPETSTSTTSLPTATSSGGGSATAVTTTSSSAAAEPQAGGPVGAGSLVGSLLLAVLQIFFT